MGLRVYKYGILAYRRYKVTFIIYISNNFPIPHVKETFLKI